MKIGILGCCGRMGKQLLELAHIHPAVNLIGGIERANHPDIGKDIGLLLGKDLFGIQVSEDLKDLVAKADAIIDFTSPHLSTHTAQLCATHNTIHICGTTGLSIADNAILDEAAHHTVIIWSSNMSIGVTLLQGLTKQLATALDTNYDIEVLEMHHKHKKDAPSGTALTLGEAAAQGRNKNLADLACYSRVGLTGERPVGEIGFATLRGGSVVGDHTVIFASEDDRIEITHKASNRTIYAKGALQACLWAKGRSPGRYTMQDVLFS